MKIKQVEELVGITRKNIRFYEDQGLLSVGRSENGYREYGTEDVKRLKEIRLLRRLGVSIEEIRDLFQGRISLEELLDRQVAYLERQRESYYRMQTFCNQLLEKRPTMEKLDADDCLEQMERMEQEGVIFVDNTKQDVQKKKQLGALLGAGIMVVLMASVIILMLWASTAEDIPIGVLLYMIGIPTLIIIGVVAALISRIKEIRGGEEDEAAKY